MTDRLSTLLHDQAATLDVPAVPADDILARGRGLQRRRRTTTAVAGAVAAVLVAGVVVAAVSARHDDSIQPANSTDQRAYQERGAWAVGDDIHIGNHVVTLPGVDALRYTSLGVLAWDQVQGTDAASTRSTTALITPDGEIHPLDLPGLDRMVFSPPTSDPTTPYIAYMRPTDESGRAELVLADLATGDTTVLGKPFSKKFPSLTRITFVGDDVLVDAGTVVDRDTGEAHELRLNGMVTSDGYAGDRYLATDMRGAWQVYSTDDDTALLKVRHPSSDDTQGQPPSLSPDGDYLAVPAGTSGIDVYTVATGESVHLGGDRDVSDYGWTPDGHLIGKPLTGASEVETCDPATGECTGLGATVAGDLTLVRGAEGLPLDG